MPAELELRLNPRLYVLFLDGAYHQTGNALVWLELPHLCARDVGDILERDLRFMERPIQSSVDCGSILDRVWSSVDCRATAIPRAKRRACGDLRAERRATSACLRRRRVRVPLRR